MYFPTKYFLRSSNFYEVAYGLNVLCKMYTRLITSSTDVIIPLENFQWQNNIFYSNSICFMHERHLLSFLKTEKNKEKLVCPVLCYFFMPEE